MEQDNLKDDVINNDMENIFKILDEQEMTSERESLTTIIENYNLNIDDTIKKIENIIDVVENVNLRITDFLFTILSVYAVYCFSIHNDIFGLILSFSIFIIWNLRDKVTGLLTNVHKED